MTDRQKMHDGIMNWIRMSDRKPTIDDADESGTVWVYDRVFADVSSVHFYQTDSYTHWMPKPKLPTPPGSLRVLQRTRTNLFSLLYNDLTINERKQDERA